MDDSSIRAHPRAKWLRWIPGQRHKCLFFKQQVPSWIWFLCSGSRCYTSCVPTSHNPSLPGDCHTGRGLPSCSEPWPLQGKQSSLAAVHLAVLVYQIKPPLTSTSLLFSLFLPMELLPLRPSPGQGPRKSGGGHTGRAAGGQSLIGSLISSLTLRSPATQFISALPKLSSLNKKGKK